MAEQTEELPLAPGPKKKVSIWYKIFAAVIIFTMIGWVLAAYVDNQSNPDDNNNNNANTFDVSGYTFFMTPDGAFNTMFETGGGEMPVPFRLDPREAVNIPIDDSAVPALLSVSKVYITSSPKVENYSYYAMAGVQIARLLGIYGIETLGAYTEDNDPPNPNVPLRTCSDANLERKVAVIYVHLDNTTEVRNENGCIHITGPTVEDLVEAADKLGYHLIGVKI